MHNLRMALGRGRSEKELEAITKKVFINLGITFFELMRIPRMKATDLEGYVDINGLENLVEALKKGKGVMLLTAHFGNWELLAAQFGLRGYKVDIVARPLDNPLAEELLKWVRTRCGNNILPKKGSMIRLMRTLKRNGVIGILADQNVGRTDGVFVDFFDRLACTNKWPALLAGLSGAAVIPTFIVRSGKGHTVHVCKELELSRTENRERDTQINTSRYTAIVEHFIRRHPEQWFWVHRRWKTRPEAEENSCPSNKLAN
jgi:KDO2-lipid IV(A) lauroyltransferase